MACSPATPPPMTNTRAGVRVPPAVIIIGNIRGSVAAARSTALYPTMVAVDDRTSMAWARVVRGSSSSAKAVAPRAANACTLAGDASGSRNPTVTWRGVIPSKMPSGPRNGRTWSRISAAFSASAREPTTRAPFST